MFGRSTVNHPHQVARRGADDGVDTRTTPQPLFDSLAAEFGGFTLDAAAIAKNAKTNLYYDISTDGLSQRWAPERVWCNPPFSSLEAWVRKAWQEHERGCPLIVMLLPSTRTEQPWWHELVEPRRDRGEVLTTRFIRGRVSFGRAPGCPGKSPAHQSVLLIWQRKPRHRQR